MFVLSLWLPDEAKIETDQEEDQMDDGAATADLRCLDKTCPQQRHRNIGEIEIEQDTRRHEECACQKFAKVPVSPGEIEAPDSHDDGCSYIEGYDHAFLLSAPFQRIWAYGETQTSDEPSYCGSMSGAASSSTTPRLQVLPQNLLF